MNKKIINNKILNSNDAQVQYDNVWEKRGFEKFYFISGMFIVFPQKNVMKMI